MIYQEPVFENEMDAREEEDYNSYVLFTLQKEREHINIWIQGANGSRMCFKLKRNTRLEKVTEAYCKAMNSPSVDVRFLYDGRSVLNHHTPAELDMGDEDTIGLLMVQRG
jgi:small ubiquitin-related modifier